MSRNQESEQSFCGILANFADVTSLQGVPFIRNSIWKVTKVAWVVVFLGAVSAWLFHSYHVCLQYYAYDTMTRVQISHDTLPFPSVTVCNINPLRRTMVEDVGPDNLRTLVASMVPRSAHVTSSKRAAMLRRKAEEANEGDGEGDLTPTDRQKISVTDPDAMKDKQIRNSSRKDPDNAPKERRKRVRGESAENKKALLERVKGVDEAEDSKYESFINRMENNKLPSPQRTSKKGQMLGSGKPTQQLVQEEVFKEIVGLLNSSLRAELGHQKEVFILHCTFNGMRCSSANFTESLTADYGNCFTFNTGRMDPNNSDANGSPFSSLYAARAGVKHGLHLKLFIEHDERLRGLRQGKGIRLAVHQGGTMPFVAENGVSMATGLALYAGLKMVNVTRKGSPYPPCTPINAFLEDYEKLYTLEACINTCLDRTVADTCGCMRKEYAEYYTIQQRRTLTHCQTEKEIDCKLEVIAAVETGAVACECNVACQSINYDMLISSNDWPGDSEWYELVDSACEMDEISCQFLMANKRDKKTVLKNNFLSVHVYYQDLNYQKIEENAAYEDAQFYSDLGGAVGLWIGATMFTIVEVLSLCLRVVGHACCRPRCRNQPSPNHRRVSVAEVQATNNLDAMVGHK